MISLSPCPLLSAYVLHIPDSDGSHPFYLDVRNGGLSHGVFLRNSDPMDVILSNDALQYRVIGGELAYISHVSAVCYLVITLFIMLNPDGS